MLDHLKLRSALRKRVPSIVVGHVPPLSIRKRLVQRDVILVELQQKSTVHAIKNEYKAHTRSVNDDASYLIFLVMFGSLVDDTLRVAIPANGTGRTVLDVCRERARHIRPSQTQNKLTTVAHAP